MRESVSLELVTVDSFSLRPPSLHTVLARPATTEIKRSVIAKT